jgi:hypothetical protein
MIAQLRRRHRQIWLALAFALPLVLLAAASTRRAPAWMEQLPAELNQPAVSTTTPLAHAAGQQNSHKETLP